LEKLESVNYKTGFNNLQPTVAVRCGRMLSRFSVASICLLVVLGQTPFYSSPDCQARTVMLFADDDSSQGLSRDASWETPEANKVITPQIGIGYDPSSRPQRN